MGIDSGFLILEFQISELLCETSRPRPGGGLRSLRLNSFRIEMTVETLA
jgi:hypothetical protein